MLVRHFITHLIQWIKILFLIFAIPILISRFFCVQPFAGFRLYSTGDNDRPTAFYGNKLFVYGRDSHPGEKSWKGHFFMVQKILVFKNLASRISEVGPTVLVRSLDMLTGGDNFIIKRPLG